jgi:hypothetical protein
MNPTFVEVCSEVQPHILRMSLTYGLYPLCLLWTSTYIDHKVKEEEGSYT